MANLIFQSVFIKNFQTFTGEHELDLSTPSGLVYVTGINHIEPDLASNGAGKTTLFTSIVWCLYGKTLRSARPGSAIEPWGPADTTEVRIVFQRDGNDHLVRRSRRPNSLFLDEIEVEQGAVDEAIGLSYEALTNTIIIGQFNEMFLNLRPERQAALFAELLQLDLWADSADRASQAARSTESQLADIVSRLSRYEGQQLELQDQINQLEAQSVEWDKQHVLELETLRLGVATAKVNLEAVLRAAAGAQDTRRLEAAIGASERELATLRASERAASEVKAEAEKQLAEVNLYRKQLEAEAISYDLDDPLCPACKQVVSQQHIRDKLTKIHKEVEDCAEIVDSLMPAIARMADELMNTRGLIEIQEEVRIEQRTRLAQINKIAIVQQAELSNVEHGYANAKYAYANCVAASNPVMPNLDRAHKRLIEYTAQIKSFAKKRDELQQTVGDYRFWVDGFKQIRLNLIDETLQELEVAVNRHAEHLGLHGWTIKFDTERETGKGDIRNKFTVSLFPPDQEEPIIYEAFSGGETQRWNLATTFGLAETLLSRAGITTNILVLDEPTHHLSDNGVESLLEYLKQLTVETGLTVFFIDHHALDKGHFDNVLQVEKDGKGSFFSWV